LEIRCFFVALQENEDADDGPVFVNDADVLEEYDVDEEGTFGSISAFKNYYTALLT